ncbi:LysR family transcriptional regulator [Novosphingobium sp. ST904]|uniref:LysR family transcriptional regulator n=1 Tax=Novosphingobium sp. ST904 TaxID=1684385 RepID=UPI001052432B|nr:LysR family transcriptional regulator [Novosphingobium sp. ST904]TCM40782.1 DNA-binding transcriptional LysR family regulator [Novosphingobium sp. ST904]
MLTDELADLAVFLAVAEARSFTRAAARLGRSQSALSQTVRRLEERLQLPLLTRTTRSVAPTSIGEQLLEALRPAFCGIEERLAALGEMRERPAGGLRLTAGRHAAETVLWPAVLRLTERYPDIQVEVSLSSALVDIVSEQFDAGVRLGEQIAKDMIAARIGPDLRMAVVAAPAYLERYGKPEAPHDLTGFRCGNIRLPTAGGVYIWEFEKAGRPLNVHVNGPVTVDDMDLLVTAALHGEVMIMVMEDMVTPFMAQGRLERVLDDWCAPFAGYHLYYSSRRHASSAFVALLEELRRGYRGINVR